MALGCQGVPRVVNDGSETSGFVPGPAIENRSIHRLRRFPQMKDESRQVPEESV